MSNTIASFFQIAIWLGSVIGFLISAFFVFFGVASDNPTRTWGMAAAGCIIFGAILAFVGIPT